MIAAGAANKKPAADNAPSDARAAHAESMPIAATDCSAMRDGALPSASACGAYNRRIARHRHRNCEGACPARLRARAGCTVRPELRRIAREVEAMGNCCHVVPTDLRCKEQVEELAQAALDRFESVDVLIHNAGVAFAGHWLLDLTDDNVAELIETNLMAPIHLTRRLLPSMIERRSGFIGFIGSVGGHVALPAGSVYSATKFGLRGFAGSLRREVKEHGIKVSIISPGFVSDSADRRCPQRHRKPAPADGLGRSRRKGYS